MKPETKGSEAPSSVRPMIILAGKPTAKMFICGTTRETTPNAASVMISAMMTGAPIITPATKMPEKADLRALDHRADRRRREQRHRVEGRGRGP